MSALGLALLLLAAAPAGTEAPPIPWRPGLTFSRTSVEDDVQSVLRALLAADGLSVIFLPGVQGKVSFNFRAMPLQAAFDQLIAEYGLHASYNPATQTVTIQPVGGSGAAVHRFVTLQNVDFLTLRQMLADFGLGTEGIAFDPATSMLSITGDSARVGQIADLVKALEDHFGSQQAQALGDKQRSVDAQRSDLERQAYQDALNVQTRVFRLRFADVAPSSREFHGRTVTIPGILETLQAMLGLTGSSGPYATQRPAYSAARPATPFGRALGAGLVGAADALLAAEGRLTRM
ncbi:MAG: hypothetical protein JO209_09855, partial [Acidisphaera sp.]|nr:hypothetical protein [Acidisphaera sp.]